MYIKQKPGTQGIQVCIDILLHQAHPSLPKSGGGDPQPCCEHLKSARSRIIKIRILNGGGRNIFSWPLFI